jgi:hypothetical protein
MEVAEDLHPLVRTHSVAGIEVEGLVGGTFLSIGAGSDQAPRAPETGLMPLGSKSSGSPDNTPWDGVAIAVFLDKLLVARGK